MNIKLPDGKTFSLEDGASAYDVAKSIGPGLAKASIAAKVNGEKRDLFAPLSDNDQVELITFDSDEGRELFWHSSSHIMAQAVKELYPDAKVAIGPAIDSGFYYDFDVENPFTPEDLEKIEKKCQEIVKRKTKFIRKEMSRHEAIELFKEKGEIYKVELIEELPSDPSLYKQGDWIDLCKGPHLPNTGYVKAFKILKSSGAYWRGDETKKMLQRVYGISFPKKAMLEEHLTLLEEAAKRDHRKLGKELDLFSFHQEGAGFPFWHPKGMVVYNEVADYSRNEHIKFDYTEIKTPVILNEELWHRSGHWDKYQENMYFVDIDEEKHAIKPMNCPGGLLVYKNKPHSYKELPIKNFEFGLVHRHELSSVLHGLFRVRQFTQDDAHIFCTPDQIENQIDEVIEFIFNTYKVFGFEDFHVELSTRPEKDLIGEPEVWDKAEAALEYVLKKKEINYQLNPGDGAFYGPKIDFHITDSLKRSWQCGTIQLDFSMPMRFKLEYTDANGEKQTPVMIHRALLGSMERFIGILIEHYAGFLPLWLSPVQVKVIPVSDKYMEHAKKVAMELKEAGVRQELDERGEKVGFKIRDAELNKIPYMVIIGEKEMESGSVSVRRHKEGDKGSMAMNDFIELLNKEIKEKR